MLVITIKLSPSNLIKSNKACVMKVRSLESRFETLEKNYRCFDICQLPDLISECFAKNIQRKVIRKNLLLRFANIKEGKFRIEITLQK